MSVGIRIGLETVTGAFVGVMGATIVGDSGGEEEEEVEDVFRAHIGV
jgi:hypothetical protein